MIVATQALIWVAVALLAAAAALALHRLGIGPTGLDRVVASDVIVAILIAAVAAEAVAHRNATGLPVILMMSLLGFTGAVGVARLVASTQARDQRFRAAETEQEEEDA